MKIKVRTILGLVPLVGGLEEQIIQIEDNSDVMALLNTLFTKYGDKLKKNLLDKNMNLGQGVSMYCNGVSILTLKGLSTGLKDGDDFLIFPPVGGG